MDNTKILWKEGMFLQPQHFQQAERYLLNNIHSRITAFQPYYFGVTEVEIDRDALSNELLTLNRCTGILPDGTTFSIPREDAGPQSRSFTDHFSMDQQTLDIYLALPLIQQGRGNVSGVGPDSHQVCRYSSKTVGISDEVFGTRRKEVEVGAFSFYILFGDESLDNYSTVQIGRLKRTPSGQIGLQEDYIPPLLQIGASRYLLGILRSMLEMLVAKSSNLSQGRRQVEGGFAEFTATEETAFRLLQTINTYTPLLNYHHFSPLTHPFDLYSLLTMFGGALSTFSTEVSIRSFPQYDHQNLSFTFGTLVNLIRSVLEADISAGCVAVPIEQVNQATFVCKVPDERLFSNAKFFLGVSARVP
ncbi:MAG: type VI secretion system baseplate subunit TssK, partial [Fibrobacter sp.]|nr:type VI secretion system baseplate subunit TssK [Fibrobacter sp.]